MTKEFGLLLVLCALFGVRGVTGVMGLCDLGEIIVLRPYAPLLPPLLLGPFSAHFSSACFTMRGYLEKHPTFPALCMYLWDNNIHKINIIFIK